MFTSIATFNIEIKEETKQILTNQIMLSVSDATMLNGPKNEEILILCIMAMRYMISSSSYAHSICIHFFCNIPLSEYFDDLINYLRTHSLEGSKYYIDQH